MIQVEIWSDVVCPFCFIGKKNFEAALKAYAGPEKIEVVWKSFELDPNAKKSQQIKIYELIAKKYRQSVEWAKENNQRLTAQGKTMGIDFDFEGIIPTNSFDAHRLSHLASLENKQNETAELLFKAYFSEGKDIASHSVLLEVAKQAGLNIERAKQILESKDLESEVRSDEEEAQQLGISGVPAFVFNRKLLVSGAQPVEAFLEVFEECKN
jgi:predicted DsbA family dithiol-disulfide isomerase